MLAPLVHRTWFGVLRTATGVGRRLRSARWLADRTVRRVGVGPSAPPEVVARVRESFLTTRAPALAATTLASLSHDGTDLAPALPVPTLVLHGRPDLEVPDEELEVFLAALPDGGRVEFPGAGRMLPLTHPAEVAEHVARWTRRVQGA